MRFDHLYCNRSCFRGNHSLLFLISDIACIGIASVLYAVNKLFLCSLRIVFFDWYFNDILAGIFFLAYTNLLLCPAKKRLNGFFCNLLYILCWGLAWEYVIPDFLPVNATSDIWDVAAYLTGGTIYATLMVILQKIQKNTTGNPQSVPR